MISRPVQPYATASTPVLRSIRKRLGIKRKIRGQRVFPDGYVAPVEECSIVRWRRVSNPNEISLMVQVPFSGACVIAARYVKLDNAVRQAAHDFWPYALELFATDPDNAWRGFYVVKNAQIARRVPESTPGDGFPRYLTDIVCLPTALSLANTHKIQRFEMVLAICLQDDADARANPLGVGAYDAVGNEADHDDEDGEDNENDYDDVAEADDSGSQSDESVTGGWASEEEKGDEDVEQDHDGDIGVVLEQASDAEQGDPDHEGSTREPCGLAAALQQARARRTWVSWADIRKKEVRWISDTQSEGSNGRFEAIATKKSGVYMIVYAKQYYYVGKTGGRFSARFRTHLRDKGNSRSAIVKATIKEAVPLIDQTQYYILHHFDRNQANDLLINAIEALYIMLTRSCSDDAGLNIKSVEKGRYSHPGRSGFLTESAVKELYTAYLDWLKNNPHMTVPSPTAGVAWKPLLGNAGEKYAAAPYHISYGYMVKIVAYDTVKDCKQWRKDFEMDKKLEAYEYARKSKAKPSAPPGISSLPLPPKRKTNAFEPSHVAAVGLTPRVKRTRGA